jgi:hypothetical protein
LELFETASLTFENFTSPSQFLGSDGKNVSVVGICTVFVEAVVVVEVVVEVIVTCLFCKTFVGEVGFVKTCTV